MRAYLFIFLFLCASLQAVTLKEKLLQTEAGDFVVTEQIQSYSVLIIRQKSENRLVLEEISTPKLQSSWKKWVQEEAPGATSWLVYEIDLKANKLIESYSFTQGGWLFVEEGDHFLTQLLALPLQKIPTAKRKRIGPAPKGGDEDRRSVWMPQAEAFETKWPEDNSRIASSCIHLYFTTSPFPTWIELQEGHYDFKIRALETGKGLYSPKKAIPKRPPQFVSQSEKGKELRLAIKSPGYYSTFKLFAIDLVDKSAGTIPLTHKMEKGKEGEFYLTVPISAPLKPGHRYRWVLVPQEAREVSAKSPFVWSYEQ